LASLLGAEELAAAARSTLTAHYTDPRLVGAIWGGVRQLGFERGRALEPGCGSGNFLGLCPDPIDATWVGVELDPTTAAITQALYPLAEIRAESFADSPFRDGEFDLAIGNVPFGDIRLHDRRHNRGRHALHNHFIVKALHLVRPGGLVAVITSAYTMDATNPAARREMAELGVLLGAVRLPSQAHARTAGTDVVTDVLIFRRRTGMDDRGHEWELSRPTAIGDASLSINEYFLDHPEHVLGTITTGGMYRADALAVDGDPDRAAQQLAVALETIVEHANRAGLRMTSSQPASSPRAAAIAPDLTEQNGHLIALTDGTFRRVDDGAAEPYPVTESQAPELRALIEMRNITVALLEAEAASIDDTDETDQLRRRLNRAYDQYSARYGPVNRFALRPTGRIDPNTGDSKQARVRPRQGGFRTDPHAPVVYALERFDDDTQTAAKADIFTQRVVSQRPARLGADSPADALAICLDEHGQVRLDRIGWLLGVDEPAARNQLGTLVFDDPESGALQPAAQYLSGNVRQKLGQARAAAETDARYEVNVAALGDVLPPDLGPGEIAAKLGATWIDRRYVEQFLREILDDPGLLVEHVSGSDWIVHNAQQHTVQARSRWGTDRMSGSEIAQHILEKRPIRIVDVLTIDGQERYIPNPDATASAQEKADEIVERYSEWAWEDPQRMVELTRAYNDMFNCVVLRNYDDVQLTLPGIAQTMKPRPHQIAAVARIIAEPAVGLYHSVGAGKTAAMIIGAMELRRLGIANKPFMIVPNHMLDQFAREFMQWYPRAKVLAAHKEDLEGDRRRAFVARAATGAWDAVIMTEAGFNRLPASVATEREYIDAQLESLRADLEKAETAGWSRTLKRLEKRILKMEERLKDRLDAAEDPGISFELTGCDYLFRDESHRDKNLATISHDPALAIEGSQRATQMDLKLGWLRRHHHRWGTRATGTPIVNTLVEAYTEFRYLRPDLMESARITNVDTFVATFADVVTTIEVSPEGGGLRHRSRLKFANVKELLRLLWVFADIKTAEDLNLPAPTLVARQDDGERMPETAVVPPSPALLSYMDTLAERAAKVRAREVAREEDNMLTISTDGRLAALDLRLVGVTPDTDGKIGAAARRIAAIWAANKDRPYPDGRGGVSDRLGALQIVFIDIGTPKPDRWNAYDELRTQLVDLGVPREKIRFIHEARSDQDKALLFAACTDGRVAIIVGSSEKMGVGVNVQRRAIALHHLDAPWVPALIEQREGRILRQGNANPEVQVVRWVTQRSFDAYMWQTVAYKATMISQLLRGKLDVREIDDIGDAALSADEVRALATGNPLLLEHARAKADVTRLERLERGYNRSRSGLQWTIDASRRDMTAASDLADQIEQAITQRRDTTGDAFSMTVSDGRTAQRSHTKRGAADDHLKAELGLLLRQAALHEQSSVVAHIGGHMVTAAYGREKDRDFDGRQRDRLYLTLSLTGVPRTGFALNIAEIAGADLVARIENRLRGLEAIRDRAHNDRARAQTEIQRAEGELRKPFRHAEALADAHQRLAELDQTLAGAATEFASAPPATAAAPSPPPLARPMPAADHAGHAAATASAVTGHDPRAAGPEVDRAGSDRPITEEPAAQAPAPSAPHDAPPPPTPVEATDERPAIVLTIDGSNVVVSGTQRGDEVTRAALHAGDFSYSGRMQAWYLPRNWRPETQAAKIGQFLTAMQRAGRDVEVIRKATPTSFPASATDGPVLPEPARRDTHPSQRGR
jgi:N12 class adenine-specific DNA methylase